MDEIATLLLKYTNNVNLYNFLQWKVDSGRTKRKLNNGLFLLLVRLNGFCSCGGGGGCQFNARGRISMVILTHGN